MWSNNENLKSTAILLNKEIEDHGLNPSEMNGVLEKFYETFRRDPTKIELQSIIEEKINKKMADTPSDMDVAHGKMITWVENHPHYAQCLLHIKAYRNYHKGEKEEFVQRIQVIDERYSTYGNIIDRIQISIILLSAISAFIQAGNNLIGFSDIAIQFVTLCVASYSALVLSISKYYKLDEQKEGMNNLRNQCADLVGELGAREDRLNTLCAKELWAGPPGAPTPPVVDAWKNERDDMFTSLKSIIQKKQTLVSIFNHLMDSKEARNLILRARQQTVDYKKKKYEIARQEIVLQTEKKQLLRDIDNAFSTKIHQPVVSVKQPIPKPDMNNYSEKIEPIMSLATSPKNVNFVINDASNNTIDPSNVNFVVHDTSHNIIDPSNTIFGNDSNV